MMKQPTQSKSQLLLHQVLEEEYIHLHGDLICGPDEDVEMRLKNVRSAIHGLSEGRSALCLSGGGIRSATFALGILQGLARCDLLSKFHYLSTVSGGGYIGAWLTAWISRAEGHLSEVSRKLASHEPDEVRKLRSYSNYLSPRLGLLSGDAWSLVGTYLRNLFLNWSVMVPLLISLCALPRIYASLLMVWPAPFTAIPLWVGLALAVIGLGYISTGVSQFRKTRHHHDLFFTLCLLPIFLSAVCLTLHLAWFRSYGADIRATAFIYGAVLIHLCGWVYLSIRAKTFALKRLLFASAAGCIQGALLGFVVTWGAVQPLAVAELYICFAVPTFLGIVIFGSMFHTGFSSAWMTDAQREWLGRATGWMLAIALGWVLLSALVVFGSFFLGSMLNAVLLFISGGIAILLSATSGKASPSSGGRVKGTATFLLSRASVVATALFLAFLIIFVSDCTTLIVRALGTWSRVDWNLDSVSHVLGRSSSNLNVLLYTPWWIILCVAGGFAVFGVAMAYPINANIFSLHAMYRDRLIRGYLGVSNQNRVENSFTGFDELDDVKLGKVWSPNAFNRKLLPVVNVALNLVRSSNLAWQERKAASFTMSPLHSGSSAVGYRRTDPDDSPGYGGRGGVSLGTAVTISGQPQALTWVITLHHWSRSFSRSSM
jgi:hypothetical protein